MISHSRWEVSSRLSDISGSSSTHCRVCATLKCEDRSLISPRKIYLDTMRPIQLIQSNVVLHANRETIYRWMARNLVKVAELAVEKIKKKFIYFLVSFDMCLTTHFSCQTVDTYKLSRVSEREKKMQRQSERICRIAFEIAIARKDLSCVLANNSLKSHKKIRRSSTPFASLARNPLLLSSTTTREF